MLSCHVVTSRWSCQDVIPLDSGQITLQHFYFSVKKGGKNRFVVRSTTQKYKQVQLKWLVNHVAYIFFIIYVATFLLIDQSVVIMTAFCDYFPFFFFSQTTKKTVYMCGNKYFHCSEGSEHFIHHSLHLTPFCFVCATVWK